MRLKVFNFLAVLSLAFCVAIVALWARSYSVGDQIAWDREREGTTWNVHHHLELESGRGGICFFLGHDFDRDDERRQDPESQGYRRTLDHTVKSAPKYPMLASPNVDVNWTWCGFQFLAVAAESKYPTRQASYSRHWLTFPYWSLVLVFSISPIMWSRRRRMLTRRLGCCPECGYDLRATPNRCPECGATPPPHNPAMQRTGAAGTVSVV